MNFPPLVAIPSSEPALFDSEVTGTGQSVETETVADGLFRGAIIKSSTGDTLSDVAVEIFLFDREGQIQRVYTGLAHGGKFTLPLLPESTHLLILRKAGYESKAFLVEAAEAQQRQTFTLDGRAGDSQDKIVNRKDSQNQNLGFLASTDRLDFLDLSEVENKSSRLLAVMASQPQRIALREKFVERGSMPFRAETEPEEKGLGRFFLTAATSFRKEATHKAEVILRFEPGDEIEILEKTNQWWWRVRHGDQPGYVKARLLAPAK